MWGTYLHGLFDTGELTAALARWLLERKGLHPEDAVPESHWAYKERQYDLLARQVRENLDLKAIWKAMEDYEHG